jgi:hypothetical protein
MKMEQIECFETSAYKIQTPGNHPEENIQHMDITLWAYSVYFIMDLPLVVSVLVCRVLSRGGYQVVQRVVSLY